MRYIADVLSFSRLIMAIWLFYSIIDRSWPTALIVLVCAVLTDVLDGSAARMWPYSDEENARLLWRKDPHLVDNVGDFAVTIAFMVGLAVYSVAWVYVLIAVLIGTVVNLSTINLFVKKGRSDIAEKIDVVFGWEYGLLLFAGLMQITMLATEDWIVFTVIYVIIISIIVILKWNRVTTRPETRNRTI